MFSLPSLSDLVVVVLFAVGMSFVCTGSTIGILVRAPVRATLGKVGIGNLTLGSVFTCPYCNAWWGGLLTAALADWSWFQCLIAAFVGCGVAAIVQAQWALAADSDA